MKRLIVVVLTLALSVAVVSAAFAAKGTTTNVKSKVKINYQTSGTPPYDEGSSFFGKVKSKSGPNKARKACKKHRKVKIKPDVGKAKTDKHGKYQIFLDHAAAPGTYTAKAKKKKIKKHHTKIVCKKAKKSLTIS
jgi:hypothetical protein